MKDKANMTSDMAYASEKANKEVYDRIRELEKNSFTVGEVWTWQDEIETPLIEGRKIISVDRETKTITLGEVINA